MEYVMVPVPNEFVVDVMQYVSRLVSQASLVPWDKETLGDFFDSLEETGKSLLSLVARYTVADKEVGYDQATEQLELSEREIREIAREINLGAQRQKFEPLLVSRETAVQLRSGRTAQRWMFVMAEPVARLIRAHERTDVEGVEVAADAAAADSSVNSSE